MNKIAKASIATTAGVILLLGGGGTFATWNASAGAGAGATITAGELDVIADEEGSWTVGETDIEIDEYLVSPGDVLTYTKPMTIVATGGSMEGYVGLSEGSIVAVTGENLSEEQVAANEALAAFLEAGAVITVAGTEILADGEYFEGLAGEGIAQDITLTATITFPYADTDADTDNGDHNAAMNGVVDLQDFTVTISQGDAPTEAE